MPQICISPAAVTVPPLMLSVPRRWLCQPRPVPSPVVTTVPPEFTVSVPGRLPYPLLACNWSVPAFTVVPPVKVLAAVNVRVPAPDLVSTPAPP